MGARSWTPDRSESGPTMRRATSSNALPKGSASYAMPVAAEEEEEVAAHAPGVFLGGEVEAGLADRVLADETG
eukprot:4582518-Alexandrium_andersonii.AAC.1